MSEFHLIYLVIAALNSSFMAKADEVVAEAIESKGDINVREARRTFNIENFTNELNPEAIRKNNEFGSVYCQTRTFTSEGGGGNTLETQVKEYEVHVDIVIVERGQIPEQLGIIVEAINRSIKENQNKFSRFSSIALTGKFPTEYAVAGSTAKYLMSGVILKFKTG